MRTWRTQAFALFAALASLCATAFATEPATSAQIPPTAPLPSALAAPASPQPFAFGAETNYAPFWVGQTAPATPENPNTAAGPAKSWTAIGPFFFHRPLDTRGRYDDGARLVRGFRPLYVEKLDATGQTIRVHVLYPLFDWSRTTDGYRWNIFGFITHEHATAINPTTEHKTDQQFDIWPFYFSTQTGDPETSFHALFPIYGKNMTGHLLQDRIEWFLFPLYWRSWRNNVQTTAVLWPIFRHVTGDGRRGFSVWPLFGYEKKDNVFSDKYFLWPFFFHNTPHPWEDTPADRLAILPFYYREIGEHIRAESFLLFWGYTHKTAPVKYDETRYFWPLFVSARGDNFYRERWAPFYTHSNINGREKTWVMWPFWRQSAWSDGVTQYYKKQFFFFLYHSVSQRPAAPDDATPAQKIACEKLPLARKTSVWPFYTYWTDGRGRRQFQAISPLEVFLPVNEPVRYIYSPFLSLYRYEQEGPGHTRHTILWNFISYRREPDLREFHIGPLYSGERVGEYKRRALFCGLVGLQKTPEKGWRPFVWKFKSLQKQLAETAAEKITATQPASGVLLNSDQQKNTAANTATQYPQVRKRR